MASNRLRTMDPKLVGGELAKLIQNYTRLCDADEAARKGREQAERAVVNAQAREIAEAAAALQANEPAPDSTLEQDARNAAEVATREAEVARVAHRAAVDAVAHEVTNRFDVYAGRLDKSADAATATALNHLRALEAALTDLQTIRAYRAWLDRPGAGDDLRSPNVSEAFALSETVRRPSGEPAMVSTLTAALHEVLEPAEHPQGDQRASWGIPTGAVKPEHAPRTSTVSQAAQRLLAEQTSEAADAAEALAAA